MEEDYLEDRKRYEYLIYIRNRKYTLYAILFSVIGLAIILTKELIINFTDRLFSTAFITVGGITLASGVGLLLYVYLQSGLRRSVNISDPDRSLRSEIEDLRIELLRLRKNSGNSFENEDLSSLINNSIDNTLTEEFIRSKIEHSFSDKVIEQARIKRFYEDFENISYRIEGELSRLRRSANLNLVIGTLTTFLAISSLGYEVFYSEFRFTDTVQLLSHYIPRISLVIFIEIFAFFFLKLYKATLEDIKYFNNEKTNIEVRLIAFKAALHEGDKDLIKLAVGDLIKTERNFKLSKGESTVELEKLKSEKNKDILLERLIEKLSDKI